jgi:DNA-binding GntR family transcriptional regulator
VRPEEIQSAVLHRLFDYAREHPHAWCSLKELAEAVDVGDARLRDALLRLETSGVIVRSHYGHGWRLKE